MPQRPGSACRRPGCAGLVRDGVCSVCGPRRRAGQQQQDQRRGTAAQRGYGGRWQRVRVRFLKTHPLCAECLRRGYTVAATDVHHIVPRRSGGPDVESNFEALCHECHSRITAQGG